MGQQIVNIGTGDNAGDGESLRTGGDKINDNFTELYTDKAALSAPAFTGPLSASTTAGVVNPRDVAKFGNLCAVSSFDDNSVALWDVSAAVPVRLSLYTNANMVKPRSLVMAGHYCYVTCDGPTTPLKSVFILDIANPYSPALAGTVTSTTFLVPICSAIYGDILIVGDIGENTTIGHGRVVFFSIANPAAPVELGHWTCADAGSKVGALLPLNHGGAPTLLVSTQSLASTDKFYILDFSAPASPTLVGSCALATGTASAQVTASNGYAFVAREASSPTAGGGFVAIDIRDRTAPAVVATQYLPALTGAPNVSSTGIWASAGRVYIPDRLNNIVYAYDVTVPAAPALLASTTAGIAGPARIFGDGGKLYIAMRGTTSPLAATGFGVVDLGGLSGPAAAFGFGRFGSLQVDGRIATGGLVSAGPVVGNDIVFAWRGFVTAGRLQAEGVDLPEQASPGNPLADVARLYAKDVGGATRVAFRDSAGTERVVPIASETLQPANNLSDVGDQTTACTNLKVSYVLAQVNPATSLTGTTAETQVAAITLPANAMGANGWVDVEAVFSFPASTNLKTLRAKLDGNQHGMLSLSSAASPFAVARFRFWNVNATNSQKGGGGGSFAGFGGATSGMSSSAVDTTAATSITLTLQLANSGETVVLESYRVIVSPKS